MEVEKAPHRQQIVMFAPFRLRDVAQGLKRI